LRGFDFFELEVVQVLVEDVRVKGRVFGARGHGYGVEEEGDVYGDVSVCGLVGFLVPDVTEDR
jgi:hypothetical protein